MLICFFSARKITDNNSNNNNNDRAFALVKEREKERKKDREKEEKKTRKEKEEVRRKAGKRNNSYFSLFLSNTLRFLFFVIFKNSCWIDDNLSFSLVIIHQSSLLPRTVTE